VKTEIFFGKSEIRLDSPVKKPPDEVEQELGFFED
jgi:hypothetical protein